MKLVIGLLVSLLIVFAIQQPLNAQSAPMISVDKAVSEFVSSNTRPSFVVKRIRIVGKADTLKASVKTSTVRSIKGDYARYKPIVDSVWMSSRDSAHHDVFVQLHLEGQEIPLPANYVRGSVRMVVSAAYWTGADWVAVSSEPFTVSVANVEIPRPAIVESKLMVTRGADSPRSLSFTITGIKISPQAKDTVDHMPEVREFSVSDVSVTLVESSLVTSDADRDNLRNVEIDHAFESNGELTVTGRISHPAVKAGKKQPKITDAKLSIDVRARLRHRGEKGLSRTRTIDISLFE